MMQCRRNKAFVSRNSLKYEQERLNTFIDWPHMDILKPEDLAEVGFYYLRSSDYTACIFCDVVVYNWENYDTPKREHQRLSPRCPFIRGDPVGNIPIAQHNVLRKLAVTRFCGKYD